LVTLEREREGQIINNTARLVGGDGVSEGARGTSEADVMRTGGIRCEDCPEGDCGECPLYGFGRNPEYLRNVEARASRRATRTRRDEEGGDRGANVSL